MPREIGRVFQTRNSEHQTNEEIPEQKAPNQFYEDTFLPPPPAKELPLNQISTASQFETWLSNRASSLKESLNQEGPERQREFFQAARAALGVTKMNPDERAKAIWAFKSVSNMLDAKD